MRHAIPQTSTSRHRRRHGPPLDHVDTHTRDPRKAAGAPFTATYWSKTMRALTWIRRHHLDGVPDVRRDRGVPRRRRPRRPRLYHPPMPRGRPVRRGRWSATARRPSNRNRATPPSACPGRRRHVCCIDNLTFPKMGAGACSAHSSSRPPHRHQLHAVPLNGLGVVAQPSRRRRAP